MKNIKNYYTAPGGPIIVLLLSLLVLILTLSSTSTVDTWIPWVFMAILLGSAIDMKFGIRAFLDNDSFYEVKHFIVRKKINISDIKEIKYQPTWIFGGQIKSIYLISQTDQKAKIKMANGAYPQHTLASLASDLKEANPSIKLDDSTQKLIHNSRV